MELLTDSLVGMLARESWFTKEVTVRSQRIMKVQRASRKESKGSDNRELWLRASGNQKPGKAIVTEGPQSVGQRPCSSPCRGAGAGRPGLGAAGGRRWSPARRPPPSPGHQLREEERERHTSHAVGSQTLSCLDVPALPIIVAFTFSAKE